MVLGEGENFFSREKAEMSASVYFLPPCPPQPCAKAETLFKKSEVFLK
jgi:hypothetical protein